MGLLSNKTGLPSFSAVDESIINYFADPGFERGTDGVMPDDWFQYNDGAVAIPVDGTGGAANANVTMLITTAGAIRGTKSALITKGPGNQQGTGYSYPFTIANPDKGVTSEVDFELVTSAAYVTGDLVFYIYDVTNSVLITPRAVQLPALPNYGKFFSDYGLQTGTQYRFILHIASTNANAWTVTLDSMTNSTNKNTVQGPPVYEVPVSASAIGATNGLAYTNTTISNLVAVRVLSFLEITGKLSFTGLPATGTGALVVRLSGTGLNIDPTRKQDWSLSGVFYDASAGGAIYNLSPVPFMTGSNIDILFNISGDTASTAALIPASSPVAFANGDLVTFSVRIPITEYGGSATYGPGSVTQWASDDGTSDVLGPQGSLVPNVAFGTGSTARQFSFSIPQDLRQFLRCEINFRGNGWMSASDLWPPLSGNNSNANNIYGISGLWSTSTIFQVAFGNRGTSINASNVDNGNTSWATENSLGTRFRVGLSVGGVFIGVNMANSSQLGFVAPRKGQTALTVTSGIGGWAIIRAVGIYYQDQDGNHRLRFNIMASFTSTTYASGTFTISGVTFKNVSNYFQAISGYTGGGGATPGSVTQAYVTPNTSNATLVTATGTSVSQLWAAGDVELESKPSWA